LNPSSEVGNTVAPTLLVVPRGQHLAHWLGTKFWDISVRPDFP